MNVPKDLYYTRTHEWVRLVDDVAVVGITDYAQEQLGDLTFVELPAPDESVSAHDEVAVIESVKAASDVYAPASGTVTEANAALGDEPELVNTDPENGGWLFRLTLSDAGELAGLMDRAAYDAFIASL